MGGGRERMGVRGEGCELDSCEGVQEACLTYGVE